MQYRINPKNGDRLSILGYGCMRFSRSAGVAVNQSKTEEELFYAYNNGVNYFDTAYIYPGSEAALGKFISKVDRKSIFVSTKLPHKQCRKYEDFDKIFSEELKRLQTDYIDYYFIHMIGDLESFKRIEALGFKDWIAEKKRTGVIRNLGFSYHGSTDEFKKLIDYYDFDICLIQLNFMDESTQAGVSGMKYAASKGVPVVIMEPLRGGRLANLKGKAAKIVSEAEPKRSPAEWGFRWLWNYPEITVVLSGMNDIEQVKENLKSASDAQVNSLTDEQLEMFHAVKDELNKSIKVPCTGCGYCMPCPSGVDIPACFSSYNRCYSDNYLYGVISYIMTTSLREKSGAASECIKCGRCEKLCPQHILIRDELDEAASVMEGVLYKMAMPVIRTAFHIKK